MAAALSVGLLLPILLGRCGGDDPPVGTIGYVEGFFGAVAADDPQAALIGRDVLSAGGTAADAVTAMYFVAAVTLPSRASLGGGGVCIGFDSETGQVSAIDFLARAPASVPESADRPTAVPGNVRGFFAFHARFGRLRWSQLLAPAENLARFGAQVSRALATDIAPLERALIEDPEIRRLFAVSADEAAADGTEQRMVREGDFIRQVELATVLARVRSEGAGAFYTGVFPQQFADAATTAGGSLAVAGLRAYRPRLVETVRVAAGDDVILAVGPPAAGGVMAAQILALLQETGLGDSAAEQIWRIAEASSAAARDRQAWQARDGGPALATDNLVSPTRLAALAGNADTAVTIGDVPLENPSAASFVAVDRDGSAAACSVTLNSAFGTGRIAPGTGIVLAAAPGPGGRGASALGPMLIVNENVRDARFAGAASGGVAAPAALAGVAARVFEGGQPLASAIAAPRALSTGAGGLVYGEPGDRVLAAVRGRGVRFAETPSLGRVAAVACPGGARGSPESCAAAIDPRGHGLAVAADQ